MEPSKARSASRFWGKVRSAPVPGGMTVSEKIIPVATGQRTAAPCPAPAGDGPDRRLLSGGSGRQRTKNRRPERRRPALPLLLLHAAGAWRVKATLALLGPRTVVGVGVRNRPVQRGTEAQP